jgi:histidinol-phosphate phosphatase family protein
VKQVVILAGGKGTRLRERLGGLPKPLVDICGLPLLERQILLVKRFGFTDALILVNHAAEYILEYCASKNNWGMRISCIDDGHPRGTAGATLAVFDLLADEFLVMYGDTMLEVDLARFYSYHKQVKGVAATLFLHPNDHPHDSDLVELDDAGLVTGFYPYPHSSSRYFPNLVNAALYWVSKQALAPWSREAGMLDFGKDIFPAMLREGLVLRGYNSPEYIKDIGTPARLDKVCLDFSSGKVERASLDRPQAIVFLDRDGTINREVDHLKAAEQFELLPGVEEAIKRLNRSEFRCCVVTNQPVIARGECSYNGLRDIHNKMETLLGLRGAFVDRIYYCPHHPDSGFEGERVELKVACDCRKPKVGMIENALEEFNGARELSWMIGDTSVDIETAKRSGLKSILVETGYAGLDYREWAIPDAIVPDLTSAVSFILDQYPRWFTYCTELAKDISSGSIVLIGGQARCGKSTFGNVLRDVLQASGRRAWVLSADRWLRNEQARETGVLGRYDMAALQSLVDELSDNERRPVSLNLPGYNKLNRTRIDGVDRMVVSNSDVILIEGTVALALKTSHDAGVFRFHIEIDEESRKERVLNEYRLRGKTEAQALEVYRVRQADEYPVIENLKRGALSVSLSDILA